MERSDMGLIRLNNRNDFRAAKRAIERWSSGRPKRVRFLGRPRHVQPDNDKEYVRYYGKRLVMESDHYTRRLLSSLNLDFTDIDYEQPPTENELNNVTY